MVFILSRKEIISNSQSQLEKRKNENERQLTISLRARAIEAIVGVNSQNRLHILKKNTTNVGCG